MKNALVLGALLAVSIPVAVAKGQDRLETARWFTELAPAAGNSLRIRSDRNFNSAVQALKPYLDNPTRAGYDNFQRAFARLEKSGSGDWLAMLFEVFKESRRETEEAQAYWLKRLEERNKINDAIQQYMRELVEQSRRLAEKVRNASGDAKSEQTVRVEVKDFDVGPPAQETDRDGKLTTPKALRSSTRSLGRGELEALIKDVDVMAHRARDEGDRVRRLFNRWSEKANQMDQQLLALLRIMRDRRRIGLGGAELGKD